MGSSSVTTLTNSAEVASGAVAGNICTLLAAAMTQPGMYRVRFYVGMSGAPTAADNNNIGYACGASGGLLGFPGALGDYSRTLYFEMNGTDGISLTMAATNGAAYTVLIAADYLGRNGQLAKYIQ